MPFNQELIHGESQVIPCKMETGEISYTSHSSNIKAMKYNAAHRFLSFEFDLTPELA